MVKIFPVNELEGAANVPGDHRLPAFDGFQVRLHGCEAHLIVLRGGVIMARCSVWKTGAPPLLNEVVGVIGHFAAVDPASASELLDAATDELRSLGCTLAVGPMDGNTWRRYRLVTERGTEPPFFMEPDNPDDLPHWFAAAGFTPLATYFSAMNENLTLEDSRIPRTLERLETHGIRLRSLDAGRFGDELKRIYAVCRVSFQSNFLYTPIAEDEFLAQYDAVRAHVRPELVLLAECHEQPVGFVFAIPDLLQAKRGPVDTVVLKTVAVLPGRAYAGLGNVLVARAQQAARALGFRRVIHALMHESNNSLNLSGHYAKPFRRYTLYARRLRAHPAVEGGNPGVA
jgi:GNAT superfamily N-acetyltransferase